MDVLSQQNLYNFFAVPILPPTDDSAIWPRQMTSLLMEMLKRLIKMGPAPLPQTPRGLCPSAPNSTRAPPLDPLVKLTIPPDESSTNMAETDDIFSGDVDGTEEEGTLPRNTHNTDYINVDIHLNRT